jgi:hypothetical protein
MLVHDVSDSKLSPTSNTLRSKRETEDPKQLKAAKSVYSEIEQMPACLRPPH